ncbi:hypothetical protein HJFPF1_05119 [Paramyrothecium foliicola]|nr:hypothetical protein HJFPF1_05119 [Paramyrothecium foliicola]
MTSPNEKKQTWQANALFRAVPPPLVLVAGLSLERMNIPERAIFPLATAASLVGNVRIKMQQNCNKRQDVFARLVGPRRSRDGD